MTKRTVCIVTGTRAEYGLLRPVMHAVKKHKRLKLQVIAAGAHFLPPARTIREVEAEFPIAARVRMQQPGKTGRLADSEALGRGVAGFARAFARLKPDWVVVLGDRIEAFAAASAASIGGIAVCHIHGGDRAEGIADEAMRHAITKLAHLHCAATKLSAERIVKLGEKAEFVHVTGSPAIDGLRAIKPMSDDEAAKYGNPRAIVLMHPSGADDQTERATAAALLSAIVLARVSPTLVLAPNHDPGREIIEAAMRPLSALGAVGKHLTRPEFISLCKRLASGPHQGMLIGNSSAALIEASFLGLRCVNIGPRQNGRERSSNVIDVPLTPGSLARRTRLALNRAMRSSPPRSTSLFGDGRSGPRIASLLAKTDPHDPAILRKRNTY